MRWAPGLFRPYHLENDMSISAIATALRFEREICSRCGGCGRYSYNARNGTICFKCLGKGKVLTKRAAVAAKWANEQTLVSVALVKVGDRVKAMGSVMTVIEIEPDPVEAGRVYLHGQSKILGLCADDLVEQVLADDARRELMTAALELQNSLTKAGKPRKVKA